VRHRTGENAGLAGRRTQHCQPMSI
jgi:hypothetical protein